MGSDDHHAWTAEAPENSRTQCPILEYGLIEAGRPKDAETKGRLDRTGAAMGLNRRGCNRR